MNEQKKRRSSRSHTPLPLRIVAILMVALLLLPLISQVFELAFAVEQEEIDALKRQQAETVTTLEDYNGRLSALEAQEGTAVARYDTLTGELDYLNEQIEASETLIVRYQEEIEVQNACYEEAEETVAALTEEYTQAIRAMEAQGSTAFWSALFSATNLFELFQTLNDLRAVTAAQQAVIDQMEQAKAAAEEASRQLTELAREQEEAQAVLEEQRLAGEESLAELEAVIQEIMADKSSYAREVARLEAARDELDDEILEAETALAIQQEEERKAAEEAARKAAEEEAARIAAEEAARKAEEAEAARKKAEEAARKAAEEEAARKAAEEEAARKAAEEEAARKAAEEAARKAAEAEAAKKAAEEEAAREAAETEEALKAVEAEKPAEEEPAETAEPSKEEPVKTTEPSKEETKPSSSAVTGEDVVAYAMQFVGNPYVWGGTSLTNGVDCSGFVMKVYAHFGYSLPHYSGAQRYCGVGVSYANAQPGDVICYDGHVGIYIGDGKMVNAHSSKYGIIVSAVNTSRIVAVRRILQ